MNIGIAIASMQSVKIIKKYTKQGHIQKLDINIIFIFGMLCINLHNNNTKFIFYNKHNITNNQTFSKTFFLKQVIKIIKALPRLPN